MSLKTKREPVIFASGWDMRGSEVGEPVRVIAMENAWLSRDEIGAVESMPSDNTLADMGDGIVMTLSSGTNQKGNDGLKPWPGEAITAGSIGILSVFDDGEIGYANYTNTLTTGLLLNTVTQPTDPGVHSIVRLNDTFYVFQGCAAADRKPQKTVIGSTAIDDIGVIRPDTTNWGDINVSINESDDDNEVKGPVKYWISELEQGNESALSEPLRRKGDISQHLIFSGAQTVTFGDVHDFDMTADFCLEILVRIDEVPAASQMIWGKKESAIATTQGWGIGVTSLGRGFVTIADGSEYLTLGTKPPGVNGVGICDGKWHRLSFSRYDSGNHCALYKDGTYQSGGVATNVDDLTTTFGMIVGSSGDGGYDFVGEVTDIRVWDDTRIGVDIRYDMHNSISDAEIASPPDGAPDYTKLVGYWRCDDDTLGTDLADAGSGDNDGTLSATTMWSKTGSYASHTIDAGNGATIDVDFAASRFHGKTFNIYRSYNAGQQPFLLKQFHPLPGTEAFEIQYTGGATACVMSISSDATTPYLKTHEDGVEDLSLDLTAGANDELGKLVTVINTDGSYDCTIDSGATAGDASTLLDKVKDQDIKTDAYMAHTVTTTIGHVYTDDTHDKDLGNQLPYIHGDEPPPLAIPSVVHMNRIFLADKSKLYWSDVANEESFWWEDDTDTDGHNETGNWLNVYPDDGDRITALVSDYDSIIIFKTNHVYRLYGRRPEEFNLRPLVAGADSPVSIGCPNQNSVCATPNGLVFYWNRKVYRLNAGVLNKISAPIEEAILDLAMFESSLHREYTGTAIGYWAERDQVWLSLATASPTGTPTRTFIYDLTREIWTGQRAAGYLSPQSVRGTGIWQTAFTEEKFIGGQGGVGNGLILDIASSSTAHSVSGFWLSPFYGGDLNTWKKFLGIQLIYESASSGDLRIYYKIDDGAETLVTMDMTVGDTGDRTHQTININENGRALTIRFAAVSAHWKVFGLTFLYQDQPVSISR